MNRKILAQGDRDGACFLYSIANSYAALTDKPLSQTEWKKAVKFLPFKLDDFLSGQGTEIIDHKPEYLEGLCQDFLDQIKNGIFEIIGKRNISEKSLQNLITKDQVAIVAIENGDHWVCIVDFEQGLFNISCSATALSLGLKYSEKRSSKLSRYCNQSLLFADMKVWNNYALLVRKIS